MHCTSTRSSNFERNLKSRYYFQALFSLVFSSCFGLPTLCLFLEITEKMSCNWCVYFAPTYFFLTFELSRCRCHDWHLFISLQLPSSPVPASGTTDKQLRGLVLSVSSVIS